MGDHRESKATGTVRAERSGDGVNSLLSRRAARRQDDPVLPALGGNQRANHLFGAAQPIKTELSPDPGGGQPLAQTVRRKMESAFGADFRDVSIPQDAQANAASAQAFTQGPHIHFAAGKYVPDTQAGRQLIGHELTHVVQQRAGRVNSPQAPGLPINADPGLEAEAERLGKRAAAGDGVRVSGSTQGRSGSTAPATGASAPIQRAAAGGDTGGGAGGGLKGMASGLLDMLPIPDMASMALGLATKGAKDLF